MAVVARAFLELLAASWLLVSTSEAAPVVSFVDAPYQAVAGGEFFAAAEASIPSGSGCVSGSAIEYRFALLRDDGSREWMLRDFSTEPSGTMTLGSERDGGFFSWFPGPTQRQMKVIARCIATGPPPVVYLESSPAITTLDVENAPVIIDDILVNGSSDYSGLTEADQFTLSANWSDADGGFQSHSFVWRVDGVEYSGEFVSLFLNSGVREITHEIDDGAGSVGSLTVFLDVANIPPTITAFDVPSSAKEGDQVPLFGRAMDPRDDVEIRWVITGGDLEEPEVVTGGNTVWVPPNQGEYLVTMEAFDGTDTVTQSQTLSVSNVPPVFLTLPVLDDLTEGQTVLLVVEVFDPADEVDVTWVMPDGTVLEGAEVEWQVGNQGSGTAIVTASDDVDSVSAEVFVRIRNVPPTIVSMEVPPTASQGDEVVLSAVATDPYDDLLYEWRIGTQSYFGDVVEVTLTRPGSIQVTLEVFDDVVSVTDSRTIEVANVAPTVSVSVSPESPDEGQQATIQVSASEPSGGQLQYTYIYGDGTNPRVTTQTSVQHTWVTTGTYNLTVQARDPFGGVGEEVVPVEVQNLPPVILSVSAPIGFEGVPSTYRATATDPGQAPLEYSWDFGDGSPAVSGQEVQYTHVDNGTYQVTVTVTDVGGASASETVDVEIRNLPPVLGSIEVSGDLVEEGTVFFSIDATDAPGDVLTYTWDMGDGTVETTSENTFTYSWPDDGVFQVSVTVSDGDLASIRSTQVTILNLPPVIVDFSVGEGDPGEPIPYFVSATDVAADTISYSWDFGDGSSGSTEPSGTHVFAEAGAYTVTVTVSDEDGGVTRRSVTVPIGDVEIVLDSIPVPDPIDEGDTIEITANATSFAGLPLTYTWDPGDGSDPIPGETLVHTYRVDGVYTATVTVTDGENVVTGTVDITVRNVPPQPGAVSLPTEANEGDTVVFFFPATDPGDDVLVWTWRVDGQVQADETGDTFEFFAPDNGIYDIEVVVSDGSGGTASAAVSLVVANVPPTGVISGDSDDSDGQTLTFTVDVFDPGVFDTVRIDWDFGDGTRRFNRPATVSHTYTRNGSFTVEATLTDNDGGVGTAQWFVTIDRIGPVVSQFIIPSSVNEGQRVDIRCEGFDLGLSGGVEVGWDMGNGDTFSTGVLQYAWPKDGVFEATCTVTDLGGRKDARSRTVTVANVPPQFGALPPTQAEEAVEYVYDPLVSDPGDDVVTFDFDVPEGVETDPATGKIQWVPGPGSSSGGPYAFSITASDDSGGVQTMSWEVDVVLVDQDGDGLPDAWEERFGLNPSTNNANLDPDGDGRINLVEYQRGTHPRVDDRPRQATAIEPVGGVRVPTAQPELIWERSVSPVGDPLTYDVVVYANAAGTQVATSVTGLEVDTDLGTWDVDTELVENAGYFWRVRAFDSFGYSPWTPLANFVVNAVEEPPGIPVLLSPPDGAELSTPTPMLEVFPTPDPDGDAITMTIIVETVGGDEVARATGIEPLAGRVVWQVSPPLALGGAYRWFAFSTDETGLTSELSLVREFSIEGVNQPPSAPTFVYPENDVIVPRARPTLVVSNGVDPEGDPLAVVFEIDRVPTYDSPSLQTAEVPAGASETEWSVPLALGEDVTYYARARMVEVDSDRTSPWDEVVFLVSETNDPPGQPDPVSPDNGFVAANGEATLVITEVEDPEGSDVFYDFEVRDLAGAVIEEVIDLPGTDTGTVSWTVTGLPPGQTYRWRGRGVDAEGMLGPWSEERTLIVPAQPDTGEPDTDEPVDTDTPGDSGQTPDTQDTSGDTDTGPQDSGGEEDAGCGDGCATAGWSWRHGAGLGLLGLLLRRRRRS